MTSEIRYEGELRTEAIHLRSGNIIVTDAPPDNNGKGEAFSPTDLFATSLASCMLTIMGILARRKNIDMAGTRAECTKVMAENPRRVAEVQLNIILSNEKIPVEERAALESAGLNCPVAKSLHPEIKQAVEFIYS